MGGRGGALWELRRSDWLKREKGGRKGGGGLKREEEEQKDKKKKKSGGQQMDQDASLVSPSHPSRRGNVMETLKCFQTMSTMATTC